MDDAHPDAVRTVSQALAETRWLPTPCPTEYLPALARDVLYALEQAGMPVVVLPEPIGYIVLAKRPDEGRESGFDYQPASFTHPKIGPCENHAAYCTDMAARDYPARRVEYVIARMELA